MIEQACTCSVCGGTGEMITKKCDTCHGKKYIETKIKKDIEIPAGIEDGMSIKSVARVIVELMGMVIFMLHLRHQIGRLDLNEMVICFIIQ